MLRILRERRHWTRADFVQKFTETAHSLGFPDLTITEKTLARWEAQDPRQPHPRNGRVLEKMLGLSLAELGFAEDRLDEPEIGWPPALVDLRPVETDARVDRRQFIKSGAGLSALVLGRLLSDPLVPSSHRYGTRIGQEHVEHFRAVMDDLRNADSRFGSARLVQTGLAETTAIANALRDGSYSFSVGQQLVSVGADLATFTGWLLFDAGEDFRAQRMLLSSLAAAGDAGDDLLSSTTLAFLSIQKLNLCDWSDALMLARAGRKLAEKYDAPHAVASLLTREARARAGAGDQRESYNAMDLAILQFDRGPGEDHPKSVNWVSLGELHGQWATCALLLGDLKRAESEMVIAEHHYGELAFRSTSLHLLRLAAGFASAGAVDESCAIADRALGVGNHVDSYRFEEVKGDLMAPLAPLQHKERVVRELTDKHEALRQRHLPRSAWSLRATA